MATQESDIPTKVLKESAKIFADFLHPFLNDCVKS